MSLLAEVSLKNNADFCGLLFRLPERSNPHSRRSSWGVTADGGSHSRGPAPASSARGLTSSSLLVT